MRVFEYFLRYLFVSFVCIRFFSYVFKGKFNFFDIFRYKRNIEGFFNVFFIDFLFFDCVVFWGGYFYFGD